MGKGTWKESLVFGDFKPNIATIMGFIHEFGHSVFLVNAQDDLAGYYAGGFNEAFAELWATQISRLPFIDEVFVKPNPALIDKYVQFRKIFGELTYLMNLKMERAAAHSVFDAKQYIDLQAQEGWRFLRVKGSLPTIPIAAQEPGNLPLYLVIGFVDCAYNDQIGPSMAEDLFRIGHELAGNSSLQHLRTLLITLQKSCAPKRPILALRPNGL